jgi:hypothetical protein
MSKKHYVRSRSLTAFHHQNLHVAGAISNPPIRVHIQSKSGVTMLSGKLVAKNDDTHQAIIRPDNAKTTITINLSLYAGSSAALMPNTIFFRRVA